IPKEAPSWFTDLDTDRDGQIGLYEWKKAGKDMAEFASLDLNNDGFITAEEWLRSQKLTQERAHQDELVASVTEGSNVPEPSTSSSRSSERGSRGPWGGSSRGSRDSGSSKEGGSDRSKESGGSDRGDRKRGGFPGGGFPPKK